MSIQHWSYRLPWDGASIQEPDRACHCGSLDKYRVLLPASHQEIFLEQANSPSIHCGNNCVAWVELGKHFWGVSSQEFQAVNSQQYGNMSTLTWQTGRYRRWIFPSWFRWSALVWHIVHRRYRMEFSSLQRDVAVRCRCLYSTIWHARCQQHRLRVPTFGSKTWPNTKWHTKKLTMCPVHVTRPAACYVMFSSSHPLHTSRYSRVNWRATGT